MFDQSDDQRGDVRSAAAPTDDDRMQAAIDLTGPDPSAASVALLSNHRTRVRKHLVLLIVVGATAAGLLGYLLALDDRPWTRTRVPEWRQVTGWFLWAFGLIGMVLSFLRLRRSGQARTVRERARPMKVLTTAQRKHVNRQIQGKATVESAQLPLLRYVATTMTSSPLNPWMLVAAATLLFGNAVRTDDPAPWVLAGLIGLLTLGAIPTGSRQYRRAEDFLATHPLPTHEATP